MTQCAMASAPTVILDRRGPVAWLTLDRPKRHNAFDDEMIAALTGALAGLAADPLAHIVVLAGNGPSFSAGADLEWMKRAALHSREENRRDALALAQMMRSLAELPKPTVARVHGAAIGGGFGLACCCDIVVASTEAAFALTEVRLGLVPAAIAPYVVAALGPQLARRLMLTGERIDASEAHRIGLVHEVAAPDVLDAVLDCVVTELVKGGPEAHAEVKRLVRAVQGRAVDNDLIALTATSIAEARSSAEGREGIAAFLEKRSPKWRP